MGMTIRTSSLFIFAYASLTTSLLLLLLSCKQAKGHGFLASPRSRNLLAYEETKWTDQTANDPEQETCPQCLNTGGSLARCGIAKGEPDRNYDSPRNALGGPMMRTSSGSGSVQATYIQGQDVIMGVTLTAHHKGHFVFSACPIKNNNNLNVVPPQDCFDKHQLIFVEDLLHGAKYDPNYPERAYIAPANHWGEGQRPVNYGSMIAAANYSFKMRLPPDLYGDLVLIQWYYLTANSCIHEGYLDYDWPWNYGWNEGGKGASRPSTCGKVSNDGSGTPEQFWNCADVKIEQRRGSSSSNHASSFCGSHCDDNGDSSIDKPRDKTKKKPGKKQANKRRRKKKKNKNKKKQRLGTIGDQQKQKQQQPDGKGKHHDRVRIGPRKKAQRKMFKNRILREVEKRQAVMVYDADSII